MPVTLTSVNLPKKPGVYLFKNKQGRVLYIGKATKLNERIRAYFSNNPDRAMIPELVERSDDATADVRSASVTALAKLAKDGDAAAIEAVVRKLQDEPRDGGYLLVCEN